MVKVAIFNGYGSSGFPKHIYEQIKEEKSIFRRCGRVIEILEEYPSMNGEFFQKARASLSVGEVVRSGNVFFFGVNKPYPIQCTIVNVDTDKKWTIAEYDGAEYIKYLEPKLISEELNYWEEYDYNG